MVLLDSKMISMAKSLEISTFIQILDLETQKERLEEELKEREKASVDIITSLINKLQLDNKGGQLLDLCQLFQRTKWCKRKILDNV